MEAASGPRRPRDWAVHVAASPGSSQTIGGTMISMLRLAQADFDRGRPVQVWAVTRPGTVSFEAAAGHHTVPASRVSEPGLIGRLLLMHLRRDRGLVHLHSGFCVVTRKQTLLRRLLPRRIPLVISLHGTHVLGADHPAWPEAHRANSRGVAAIIVASEAERRAQIDVAIPAAKVFVVPDVVDCAPGRPGRLRERLGLTSSTRIVLFCGRVVEAKGPGTLIAAFAEIAPRHPDAVLVIAGAGPDLEPCRVRARPLGPRVRFLGHVDAVGDLYADADVLAAPSVAESFGLAAMEGALSGVPLLLTRIEPWTDVFADGDSCLFVGFADVDATARALSDLLGNPAHARSMALRAKQIAETRFSKPAVLRALDRAYAHAVEAS